MPANWRWDIKEAVIGVLLLLAMNRFWGLGVVGKATANLIFASWCLWVWRITGSDRRELPTMAIANGIFLTFWVFSQYQRVWAFILATPIAAFCGYMCWRQRRSIGM